MALHTQLPIYKVAYGLLDVVTDLTAQFPRNFRASMGEQIRVECVDIVTLLGRANRATDKAPHLDELLERVDVIELLIRLSRDKRFISTGQYAAAIALTASIGKQANGWKGRRKHG